MKIVILDSRATTSGELEWDMLAGLGEVAIFEQTTEHDIIPRTKGAEVVLTNKVPFSRDTLSQLPDLKYIGIVATGYDKVDLVAAKERGIVVTNAAGYGTEAVAQHVFALLLALTNQVDYHSRDVKSGGWTKKDNWTYMLTPIFELKGMTLGLVGMGRIGQAVAKLGQAFGMSVRAFSRSPKPLAGVKWASSLEEILEQADVLSLHCPLTAETEGMIHASALRRMKSSAFLINTARGPLIDEPSLAHALQTGEIAGAGLDVLGSEPPSADNPLFKAPNCVITPHNAWGARASRLRLMQQVADNLRAWQQGHPQNVLT